MLCREGVSVFVAASTDCFANLPLVDAVERLADLEYSAIVICVHHDSRQITPMQVAEDMERAVRLCRDTHRLDLAGYSVHIKATGDELLADGPHVLNADLQLAVVGPVLVLVHADEHSPAVTGAQGGLRAGWLAFALGQR